MTFCVSRDNSRPGVYCPVSQAVKQSESFLQGTTFCKSDNKRVAKGIIEMRTTEDDMGMDAMCVCKVL